MVYYQISALLLMFAFPAWSQEVALIVHPDTPIEHLSKKELQKIYMNRKNFWENGTTIKAASLKKGSLHEQFLTDLVRKTEQQYSTYWKRMIFTGKGNPPKSFDSSQEVMAFVAATPGAIGYVDKDLKLEGVKTIEIQ